MRVVKNDENDSYTVMLSFDEVQQVKEESIRRVCSVEILVYEVLHTGWNEYFDS